MKSWKTTVGGLMIAAGTTLQTSEDSTIKTIGYVLGTLGALLMGFSAKDKDIAGAGPDARKV